MGRVWLFQDREERRKRGEERKKIGKERRIKTQPLFDHEQGKTTAVLLYTGIHAIYPKLGREK